MPPTSLTPDARPRLPQDPINTLRRHRPLPHLPPPIQMAPEWTTEKSRKNQMIGFDKTCVWLIGWVPTKHTVLMLVVGGGGERGGAP